MKGKASTSLSRPNERFFSHVRLDICRLLWQVVAVDAVLEAVRVLKLSEHTRSSACWCYYWKQGMKAKTALYLWARKTRPLAKAIWNSQGQVRTHWIGQGKNLHRQYCIAHVEEVLFLSCHLLPDSMP